MHKGKIGLTMEKIVNFLRQRTYMEIVATLHLCIIAVIAWCLLDISEGYISVYVSGVVDVNTGLEQELRDINTELGRELRDIKRAIETK
jgi:hypothetical protein